MEFIILPPVNGGPFKNERNLLGLGLAERARLMLEKAGGVEAADLSGDSDLVLYPGELVGPPILGNEIASFHQNSTEITALRPRSHGRPVIVVGSEVRSGLASAAGSAEKAYNMAQDHTIRWVDLKRPSIPVTDKASWKKARRMLLSSLRKRVDGLISRTVNRPISIAISGILAKTPITPNMLSLITFVTALAASAAMATSNFLAGGLLLQFSSILDGCDGEVARLKYQSSRLGAWLDTVLDDVSTVIFALAMGYGLYNYFGGSTGQLFLGLCLVAVLLTLPAYWVTYSRLIVNGTTDSGGVSFSKSPDASWFRNFLVVYLQPIAKRDGYIFLFMLLCAAGLPWMVAVMYFVGATLTALTIITDRSPSNSRYDITGSHPNIVTTAEIRTR
ncbi:MAG: CDP-alcohol phosphatidyltransferase family protein [Deltaproteobacteria bacterium]|nr:CDP-alcohol phosphatidyltransferase family protein [Deltaproteobacteria bacterium]